MARILIIDDSPTDVGVFSSRLGKAGHHVNAVSSAEEGLVRVRADLPDLVIMDVIMPGMNGFQATRVLSRDPVTAKVPILMITAKSMESDRMWGLRQGASDFVTKPVSEKELLNRVQTLLTNKALSNQALGLLTDKGTGARVPP